ncbi:MAG: aspartyl protease family protein [Syntrophobacteria bacterium]
MICPKCAFSQPDDIYCANCGVNVEKYAQKQKKGRFKIWAVVAFLAVAAITIAKFTSTKHPPAERTPGQEPATKTMRTRESAASLEKEPRRETPQPDSIAKRLAPRRQATPTPSIEQPTPKTGPQSDSKEGNLTARELFEKGVALDDDSDREIDFYQKAIEVDPNFAPAYYRLGAIYFRQADYDLSAEHFVRFLQYGSEADRRAYNVELYFSPEDLEVFREAIEETTPKPEGQEVVAEPGEGEVVETGEEAVTESTEEVQSIIRFSATSGHMIVPAVLNGSNNSAMLFDTGAGITVLSKELAQNLGLKMEPGKFVKLRTVATNVEAQMATLDSITIGDFTKTDFPVAVVDLGRENRKRFDGILGMDFLSTYIIRIDNQTSSIFLSPRK